MMPRSKGDDAARKREERLARPADDAAARSARLADDAAERSADDAARKREERSNPLLANLPLAPNGVVQSGQNLQVRVWAMFYLQLFVYWTGGLGVVFRSYCAYSATNAYPEEIQTQKLLRHR